MRIRKHTVFASLFLLCSFVSNGQNKTIDSLKRVLQMQKEDTNKVNTLLAMSDLYTKTDQANESLIQANNALNLSKKMSFKKGEGLSYLKIASAQYYMNNLNEAVSNNSLALNCFSEINFRYGIARASEALGISYHYAGNWPEGIKKIYEALRLYEKLGEKKKVAGCQAWVGLIYYWNDNYDHAFQALIEALKKYEKIDHEGHSGICYIYLANILRTQKKYQEGLLNDSIGLKMSIEKRDPQTSANAYFSIADILVAQMDEGKILKKYKEEDKLLYHVSDLYHKALLNYKTVLDSGGMGDSYQRLSETNIRLKQFTIAQKYADTALIIAKRLQYNDNFKSAYLVKAKLDSATGNFKSAFESYKNYIIYRDSIRNERYIKSSTETQMQYEFDKKEAVATAEQERRDAETRRTRNLQYTAIGIFLLIAIFLFWNNRQKQRSKTKIEKAYSELKATQQQLIQSEKMASLGELTAGIAHEIQNPLNFVNNFSDVNAELIDEANQEIDKGNINEVKTILDDIKDNEQKINHHGKRADAIVKGMLQHSRTSSGQKEPTDINALCDEYLRLAYHGLRAKDKSFNAKFETDFDNSIGKINIVPQDIGRVILNLINNAFYAASLPSKGGFLNSNSNKIPTVWVSTKKEGNKVLINVRDNGPGIPSNILDKIFQPFFTTKPTGQGTGLGLSLAYDIITKGHGGELKVETKETEGTCFKVLLQIVQ